MRKKKNNNYIGIAGFAIVSLALVLGIGILFSNQKDFFKEEITNYEKGQALNLSENTQVKELSDLMLKNGYIDSDTTAKFISNWLAELLKKEKLPNLGAINKRDCRIPVEVALRDGGEELRLRAIAALNRSGYNSSVASLYESNYTSEIRDLGGDAEIKVYVGESDTIGGFIQKAIHKAMRKTLPVSNVVVRLTQHYYEGKETQESVLGYATTDSSGVAKFKVKRGLYYSVLPIRKGYSYGVSKGTTDGALDSVLNIQFRQREHVIPIFDGNTYSRIKQDNSLTVRTPLEYRENVIVSVVMFLFVWWGFLLIVTISDKRLGICSDRLLPTVLMTLTAICMLSMYSIANPLTDRDMGTDMTYGICGGVVLLLALYHVNYIKYFNGISRVQFGVLKFDFAMQPFAWIKSRFGSAPSSEWSMPDGIGYLLLTLLLMLLLLLFGSGPEGSDAKVNLFFFQPSELSKYLIVVFIAAFFARNAKRIQAFAQQGDKYSLRYRCRMVIGILLAIFVLVGMYGILSDMGPALVVVTTFVLLYSVARKDTPHLILGVASYIILMIVGYSLTSPLLADNFSSRPCMTPVILTLAWFVLWTVGWWIAKRKVYESAIFMNFVLAAFILGGVLLRGVGKEAIGQRLTNRSAMAWSGVWQNDVPGGDQVAQGIWGLATGGLFGQGVGEGNPNLVPAFNTDMIFSSIGEVMGWVTLLLIVICLAVLLHRTLLLARRAGHPFVFYLASGIAIVTGVQFMVIVLGSLGLIPLTGVSVPFLSYGKASMIINLAAFGIVLSISKLRATTLQKESIIQYDNVIASTSLTFFGLTSVILSVLFYYQVYARDQYLIKPAYVTTMDGAFISEYNPRINLLEQKLMAGNIYDRNKVLLATSSPNSIMKGIEKYKKCGIGNAETEKLSKKKQRRYYPFAEHLLFMLGDFNTGCNPQGYSAEYRHLTELRGFDNAVRDGGGKRSRIEKMSNYRESRFLPPCDTLFSMPLYDYSKLLPMLKSGLNSRKVEEWNAQRNQRDMQLTLDAVLQTKLQSQMEHDIKTGVLKNLKKLRASVVVLNAKTGELLASANYPLPKQQVIRDNTRYDETNPTQWAYTLQDLGTTFQTQPGSTAKVISALAAFMKDGVKAANYEYNILPEDAVGRQDDERHTGLVTMERGLVKSINAFYVNLVHDHDLYSQLASVDYLTGIRIHVGFSDRKSYTPYYFDMAELLTDRASYVNEFAYLESKAVPLYQRYLVKPPKSDTKRSWRAKPEFGIAWGQHHIYATPLTMARVVQIVANNGVFVPTQYVKSKNYKPHSQKVINPEEAKLIQGYMKAESASHPGLPSNMGGKTGTPERVWKYVKNGKLVYDLHHNDAWYVCYIYSEKEQAPLAIALRLERTGKHLSNVAFEFMANSIVPVLRDLNYKIE